MCEHLLPLEKALTQAGVEETYRGQPWSNNCREWVYFDCVFDTNSIIERFAFSTMIQLHRNDDVKSGMELGFFCTTCKDAIMGVHPQFGENKLLFK